MINIRPVSDLRNKFPEIEETVINSNAPNPALTNDIEKQLDEADRFAKASNVRLSKDELFNKVRGKIDEQSNL